MTKRITAVIVVLSMLSSLAVFAPAAVSAADVSACGDDLTWVLDNDGTLTISGTGDMWNKSSLSVLPPWESAGIPLKKVIINEGVTSVGANMFADCRELESVVLPEGITRIGDYGFKWCTALSDITLPDSVTTLGRHALNGLAITELKIPAGLTVIGEGVFSGIGIEKLIIPEGVTEIGFSAFDNCKSLTEISFPSTLRVIGQRAFEGCDALPEVSIPGTVTTVGEKAFNVCLALEEIELGDGILNFGRDENGYYNLVFGNTKYYNDESNWEDGLLYIGNYLIDTKREISGQIRVRDGIKYITDLVFCRRSDVTEITLPESVERINYQAFRRCSSLTKVNLNDGIKYIGEEVFNNTALYSDDANRTDKMFYVDNYLIEAEADITGAEIKDGTIGIANRAFYECKYLASATLPESIKFIGDYAFYSCRGLGNVTIPKNIEYIGDYAFWYCDSVSGEIVIPDTLTYLGETAFYRCSLINKITIGKGLTEIKSGTFEGVGIESLTIPDNIKKIGNSAFSGCDSLADLRIGAGVEKIGDRAFYGSDLLEEIIIPDSVTYIGELSFSMTGAKSITIGSGLKTIGGVGAFVYNYYLEEFVVDKGNLVYSSQDGVLFSKDKTVMLQYPLAGKRDSYTIPDGVVTVGAGAAYQAPFKELYMADSVRYIEREAFASSDVLASVNLGKNVEVIGALAFSNVWELEEIVIPDSVKRIEDGAFNSNPGLHYVELGKNVEHIGGGAFSGCGIGSIYLPDSLVSIGELAFSGCGFSYIAIPENVAIIGEKAFYGCTGLKEFAVDKDNKYFCSYENNLYTGDMSTLIQYAPNYRFVYHFIVPDGVKNIADYAFSGSKFIEIVTLPKGLEFIGEKAFEKCGNLRELYIPESVTELSKSTIVDDCDSFSWIYYGGSEEQWDAIDFYDRLTDSLYITICFNTKYFTENTRIMSDGESTTARIRPFYELDGKELVVALYNNGALSDVQIINCMGEKFEEFEFEGTHTEIKILYWDDLESIAPTTSGEFINTAGWSY